MRLTPQERQEELDGLDEIVVANSDREVDRIVVGLAVEATTEIRLAFDPRFRLPATGTEERKPAVTTLVWPVQVPDQPADRKHAVTLDNNWDCRTFSVANTEAAGNAHRNRDGDSEAFPFRRTWYSPRHPLEELFLLRRFHARRGVFRTAELVRDVAASPVRCFSSGD